ncbi:MAG: ABC transporter permease [Porticoccaceae bacterium]
MQRILALWMARNREYYRDKGSLFWSFIATPFIVIVLAVAFSSSNDNLFQAGLLLDTPGAYPASLPFAGEPAVEMIEYLDQDSALRRIRFHQLDILITASEPRRYWVNPESTKGRILEDLLLTEGLPREESNWQRQEVYGAQIRYIDWVIPGVLAMNMMFSGLWGIGYVIVRYRKNGVLKRLQATPLKSWEFLLSQALSRLGIMLAVTAIVFTACNLFIDFRMDGSYLLLLLIALVGNLAIISISLLMATRTASEELANGLLNLISFPMLLLSELWFSLDDAPHWLREVSQLLPLTHLVKAARAVMLEGAGWIQVMPQLLVLTVMTAVCLILSGFLFKWHD